MIDGADDVTIQGNDIGTNSTGGSGEGNGDGVLIGDFSGESYPPVNNLVGGTGPGQANTIAFNQYQGVLILGGSGNAVRGNSIHDNGFGISLYNGANNGVVSPTVVQAVSEGSLTKVNTTLQAAPNTSYILDFFASNALDPSGNAEGQTFLGSATVTTNAQGNGDFWSIRLRYELQRAVDHRHGDRPQRRHFPVLQRPDRYGPRRDQHQ